MPASPKTKQNKTNNTPPHPPKKKPHRRKEGPTLHQVLYKTKPKQWALPVRFYVLSKEKTYICCFSSMEAEAPHGKAKCLLLGKEQNLSRNTMIQSNFVQRNSGETLARGQSWPELSAVLLSAHETCQV